MYTRCGIIVVVVLLLVVVISRSCKSAPAEQFNPHTVADQLLAVRAQTQDAVGIFSNALQRRLGMGFAG